MVDHEDTPGGGASSLTIDDIEAARIKFRSVAGSNAGIGKKTFKELIRAITKESGEVQIPEESALEAAFRLADDDNSGSVEEDEFIGVYEKLKDGRVAGIAIHQIIAEGVLSHEELAHLRKEFQAVSTLNSSGTDEDGAAIDSRVITRKQFNKLIKALMRRAQARGHKPSKSELDAAFNIADKDGGGSIDEEEFLELYRMVKKGEVKGLTANQNVPKEFEEFISKDKHRTELLAKGEESMYHVLMRWSQTLPSQIMSEYFSYGPLFMFALVFIIQHPSFGNGLLFGQIDSDSASRAISSLSTLVAILLVSLFQQVFDRFYDVYFEMAKCRTATISFVGMARAYIDDDTIVRALSRYSNLANVTNFIDVTPYYTKNNFFDPLTRKYRLLTPRERHLIDPKVGVDSKGAVNDIFVWLNATLQLAFDYGELTAFEKNDLNATLLEQHSALITIWNWIDQPLPFSYVNLVIVVVTLYNFLYGMLKALQAVDKDMWSLPFFAVFLMIMSTQSILRLALNMSSPFSHDDISLRVASLCLSTIKHSDLMLLSRHRDVVNLLHDSADEEFVSQEESMFRMLQAYIDKLTITKTDSGTELAHLRASTPSLPRSTPSPKDMMGGLGNSDTDSNSESSGDGRDKEKEFNFDDHVREVFQKEEKSEEPKKRKKQNDETKEEPRTFSVDDDDDDDDDSHEFHNADTADTHRSLEF